MRVVIAIGAVVLCVAAASANTVIESWEGTHTVLGLYGSGSPPIIAEAVMGQPPDPMDGLQTLQLIDNSPSGTPQAYVAWVRGLQDGDIVEASIWRHDTTPGASPSCRLWGHWNDDPTDVYGYDGSAGGNDDYGPGEGWDQTLWSWTVADGHTGLVVEIRTYSSPGDTVWVDFMMVIAPDHAEIITPQSVSPVESESWTAIKALYR